MSGLTVIVTDYNGIVTDYNFNVKDCNFRRVNMKLAGGFLPKQ